MKPAPGPSDDIQHLRQQAMDWFVRRRDSDWRAADEPAFQAWQATDPRHAAAYQACQERWDQLDALPDALLQRLRGNLARDQSLLAMLQPPPAPPPPSIPGRRDFLRPVALAGIAAVSGASFFVWLHIEQRPTLQLATQTVRGQQMEVPLPDGSRLRLDTATRVQVTYYRDRREVRLIEGQAVFDVQGNRERPFVVSAGAVRVTVVGTRFSVRHTPGVAGNDGVQVMVERGKVAVDGVGAAAPTRVLLTAGQQVASDRSGKLGAAGRLAPHDFALWRNNRISFVDLPLSQALEEFERYRPTGLLVRDPAIAALRLSGTFNPMDAHALRTALPRVLPVRLVARDSQFDIVAKKKNENY